MFGGKLNRDGQFVNFQGSTIICPVKEETHPKWYKALVKAHQKIAASEIAFAFALLPPSSYHTTVWGVLTENSGKRPADMPGTTSEQVEGAIIERLRPIFTDAKSLPRNIRFEYDGTYLRGDGTVIQIGLKCLDNDAVVKFIKQAADACKLNFDGYYHAHITLAYQYKSVANHVPAVQKLAAKIDKIFAKLKGDNMLVVDRPVLTFYRDMTAFSETPIYASNVGKNDWAASKSGPAASAPSNPTH